MVSNRSLNGPKNIASANVQLVILETVSGDTEGAVKS